MLYSEYISKAKSMCIAIDDVNNVAYLLPDYRYILNLSNLKLSDVTDFSDVTPEIVADNLKAEVTAYNSRHNMVPGIAEWLRETILTTLSPLAIEEQNKLVANIIDYMKANAKPAEPVQENNSVPETNSNTGKILQMDSYMNFSKKE